MVGWKGAMINYNAVQVSREYLAKAAETLPGSTPCGVNGIPVGKHVRCSSEPKWKKWFITFAHRRDDEQALLLLLQCGYSVEEALRRKRMNAGATELCRRPTKILFFLSNLGFDMDTCSGTKLRKRPQKILFFYPTWVLTWILAVPPADTMSLWSEEECRAFETGLRFKNI